MNELHGITRGSALYLNIKKLESARERIPEHPSFGDPDVREYHQRMERMGFQAEDLVALYRFMDALIPRPAPKKDS